MRVLLIEPNPTVAIGLSHFLRLNGAVIDHVTDGEDGLEIARRYDYDVILLDLLQNDAEGYDVLRKLRTARIEAPVIIMSGLTRPQAKVKAFSCGADDFVSKPFDTTELLARMQAVIRRSKGFAQPMLWIGPVQLKLNSREVLVHGAPVHLTAKEYAIFELLVLRRGMVLTKETFLGHLYGGLDEPEAKIIDVFVCKLRRKLADAGAPSVIGTVWGRGYMVRDTAPAHNLAKDTVAPAPAALERTAA